MWESDHKEGRPKNWCFQPVVLEKTLESPLDSKEIKPVNLKEINPEYSLMLKLKLQYFGQLIRRADSLEETLILGKFEGSRRRGYRGWDGWMTSLTWRRWGYEINFRSSKMVQFWGRFLNCMHIYTYIYIYIYISSCLNVSMFIETFKHGFAFL